MASQEPDRLTRLLLAGYTFRIGATPGRELVEVTITPPGREQLNPVFGPAGAGALLALDAAAGIAWEHMLTLTSPRRGAADG